MKKKLDISPIRLINAIKYSRFDRVKKLVKAGVDINYLNELNYGVLSECLKYTNIKCLKYFIKLGVDLNTQDTLLGDTVLMSATRRNKYIIMELLIKSGADLTKYDFYGDDFIRLATSERCGDWLFKERVQRMIIKNNPAMIKRFNDMYGFEIHQNILKKNPEIISSYELGLI